MLNIRNYLYFNKLRTMKDLNERLLLDKISPMRSNIRILIIDDEASFIPDLLARLRYTNVRYISNYNGPSDLDGYQVILCDIENVGKEMHKEKQGFAVYEQILRLYPYKVVALYTAHEPSEYGKISDKAIIINKPIEVAELANRLDHITQRFWEPQKAWDYIEKVCINKGASHKVIAILEDMFVKSFNKKNINHFELMQKKYHFNSQLKEYIGVGSEVVSLLLPIASNFIKR